MNVRFLTIAEQEVDDVYQWFEGRTEGLGMTFLTELDRGVSRIRAFPFAGSEIEPEIRRCLLVRFPYAIIYGIDGETIIVIGIAHSRREPHYWIDRMTS